MRTARAGVTPHFQVVATTFARGGVREPSVVLTGGDLVECLVRTGRRVDAEDALSSFEDLARRADRIGARAIAARCRGLLANDDAFEGLGAVDWPATARGELGVTGETAAARSGPRSDALTPRSSRWR